MAVMGAFAYEDDFLGAAEKLKSAGFDNISLLSPLPLEEAYEVLGLRKSRVRHFSLFGGIIGALAGFALAVGTALVFILPTGGRAIIALPPYFIITYEMTILFGVLFTLLGFHFVSGLPAWHDAPYMTSANIDRFVIVVEGATEDQLTRAEAIIKDAGADEIQRWVADQ